MAGELITTDNSDNMKVLEISATCLIHCEWVVQ